MRIGVAGGDFTVLWQREGTVVVKGNTTKKNRSVGKAPWAAR